MQVAIVGRDRVAEGVANRFEKEKISYTRIDADIAAVERSFAKNSYDYFISLDCRDETNLVLSALVKQLGSPRTVATIQGASFTSEEINVQRAFHVDHLLFSDLFVADKIGQYIFDEGIYSRSFLHGNVLLRTMKIPDESSFAGKSLSEIREKYKNMLICLINRQEKELIFAHGKDILLPGDEITMLGETDTVLEASKHLSGYKKEASSVCIIGDTPMAKLLGDRLKKHNVEVRIEERSVPFDELGKATVFVSCHSDEEHNFVLAVQAKDHNFEKVIAVLSEKETVEEAEHLGILHVPSAPTSIGDRLVEIVLGGKVSSVMSLYDAKAEILQATISVDSALVGIPLSVLGPTLPKELLLGVIYSRGRTFIAGGGHILKPNDECLVILDPKHRKLFEKLL